MANILIKKGRTTRTELERELRGEGWGRSLTDAEFDRAKYLEKKLKDKFGMKKRIVTDEFIKEVK